MATFTVRPSALLSTAISSFNFTAASGLGNRIFVPQMGNTASEALR